MLAYANTKLLFCKMHASVAPVLRRCARCTDIVFLSLDETTNTTTNSEYTHHSFVIKDIAMLSSH